METFRANLAEALAWCRPRFSMYSLETSLRAPELKPTDSLLQPAAGTVVEDVVRRRAALLKSGPTGSLDHARSSWGYERPNETRPHKLLSVFTNESLSDGTSPLATGGFIDVDDVPAWDTWVCCDDGMLVTIVPPGLVSAVQIAIDTNAYECICWLGARNHPLAEKLRRAALPRVHVERPLTSR